MAVSGNQIRAARSLAGLGQQELADAAGVSANTIRNIEARGHKQVRVHLHTLECILAALRDQGVELIGGDDGRLGVRLLAPLEIRYPRPLVKNGRLRRIDD